MKFNFKKIYVQRAIYDDFLWRANAEKIISRFPEAELVEVESHWKIPQLFGADAGDWMRTKRESLVLGIKSGLTHQKNGRSADFIAASNTNGCLSSCQYCYVARRKGASNPLTVFVNIEEIAHSIRNTKRNSALKPNRISATSDFGLTTSVATPIFLLIHSSATIQVFSSANLLQWNSLKPLLRRKPFTTIIGWQLTRKAKLGFVIV
jgi:hypothetical protein